MKRMLRTLALFLSTLMVLSVAGCASASYNRTGKEQSSTTPSDYAFNYARFGTTKEEVEAQHLQYGKGVTDIEGEIELGVVIIKVYPFALNYAYSMADFEEIDCTDVKLIGTYPNNKMPTKLLLLTISDKSLQGVSNAMEILNQRDDVYCAMPSEIIHLETEN